VLRRLSKSAPLNGRLQPNLLHPEPATLSRFVSGLVYVEDEEHFVRFAAQNVGN
jgi:hypothetical protein